MEYDFFCQSFIELQLFCVFQPLYGYVGYILCGYRLAETRISDANCGTLISRRGQEIWKIESYKDILLCD